MVRRKAAKAAAIAMIGVWVVGCSRASRTNASLDGGGSGTVTSVPVSLTAAADASVVERAADMRRAADVPDEWRTSHDVAARRLSARALARIADASSTAGLQAHLADEDEEVMSWAAYGLGYACKGHEDAHLSILSARAATLGRVAAPRDATPRERSRLDPHVSIARALGRCGTALGEDALLGLLKVGGAWSEPALLGFGDLTRSRKPLGDASMTALLDASSPSARDGAPRDMAFYALSRAEPRPVFRKRVVEVARAALARPGDARLFAIKTLGREALGKELARDITQDLFTVVTQPGRFTFSERAEAARGLDSLFEAGQLAAAEALEQLVPEKDALSPQALLSAEFHVLAMLVQAVGAEPPKKAESALRTMASLVLPKPSDGVNSAVTRRVAELRCTASLGLARGVYDAEVLRACAPEDTETSARVRLTSLLRRPLEGVRRAAFRTFAKSEHLRVREQAVEAIGQHPELGDVAASLLADALSSKKAGLVAVAANVIDQHPDRVMGLAASEKRAALDPRSPAPGAEPARELSGEVMNALAGALAFAWPEDRFETRIGLIEAAASVRHPEAKAAASRACSDANVGMRERAQKALRSLGESVSACAAPLGEGASGAASPKPVTRLQKLVFTTDADVGPLSFVLDPEGSQRTVARLASLARAGFYNNITVHRVAPAFVVQFGSPDGDGYDGSGTSLRCETSPVPFAPFDIGMALSGRDTGSSQVFVTLARTPHLDGEYTHVGHAEGAWGSLAQGDVITHVTLVE